MNMPVLPNGVLELSKIFSANGYPLFLVGGFVRNIALGISGGDFDVCSPAHPETAAAFLRSAGLTVIEKAVSLGTIEVHLTLNKRKYIFEHTTFRRDFYPSDGRHRPDTVTFTDNMEEDAKRRDFTVNALYFDIESGSVIDPTGSGLNDLKKKMLRAAADDPDETIRDDGLRIMRMARFAAELRFSVCPQLLECAQKRADLLKDISAERKRDELIKILMADTKYPCLKTDGYPHQRGLSILRTIGALPYILPVLSRGDGVMQAKKYHQHDVLGHGIQTCAVSPPILPLRLATLLHDIGKPMALQQNGNMHDHEVLGESLARDELNALRFDNQTKRIVLPLIRNHMFDLEGRAKPKTIRKRAIILGKRGFLLLIALRRADFLGSGYPGDIISADNWQKEFDRMIEQKVPWSVGDLAVTGNDIMNALHIQSSPEIGKILNHLFHESVLHPNINIPVKLIEQAKQFAQNNHILP